MKDGRIELLQTADAQMRNLLKTAEQVAVSRATILIQGESGTGKDILARYIHAKSARAQHEMCALNCAALPEGLLESELFGYEKGAFTGADQRKIGKFEAAHLSTFMLDEISEIPLTLQAKLLRVLQEGEVTRLGGIKPIKIDVRIIAASNRNLESQVKVGKFREDLFYRLNVIPIFVPPLRERPKDIELLSEFFLGLACERNGLPTKVLDASAMQKLKMWNWPGNVRELQNVIERSALLGRDVRIQADQILIESYSPREIKNGIEAGMTVAETERILIMKTLEHTEFNRTRAAELLGISIRTLRNKLNDYKVEGSHERIIR